MCRWGWVYALEGRYVPSEASMFAAGGFLFFSWKAIMCHKWRVYAARGWFVPWKANKFAVGGLFAMEGDCVP